MSWLETIAYMLIGGVLGFKAAMCYFEYRWRTTNRQIKEPVGIQHSLPAKLTDGQFILFANEAPEDAEWSAHISQLNEWSNPNRYIRDIVQYARSGPFYPADMHVSLIEQLIHQQTVRTTAETREKTIKTIFNSFAEGMDKFDCRTDAETFTRVLKKLGKHYRLNLKVKQ